MTVDLDKLLEHITATCFDYGHGFLPSSEVVVSATKLLDHLTEQTGITKEEMGNLFDQARHRVHPNIGQVERSL